MFLRKKQQGPVERLCEEFYGDLYRYAFKRLGNEDDAKAAVQTALAKLMEPKNYEKVSALDCNERKAYVVTMVKNQCIDMQREEKRELTVLDEEEWEMEDVAVCVEQAVADSLDHERVREAVKRLPERYQVYIELRYYKDYDNKEIAQILGIELSSCRSLDKRALDKLRAALREGDEVQNASGHIRRFWTTRCSKRRVRSRMRK